jgi:hypothetical protein
MSLPMGPRDWDGQGLLTALDARLKYLEADWAHPRITAWCDRLLAQRGLPRVFAGKEQHYNLPYDALQTLFSHLSNITSLEVADGTRR